MNKWIVVAFVLGALACTASHAAATGLETTEIRVRYEPRELTSPAGARRLEAHRRRRPRIVRRFFIQPV